MRNFAIHFQYPWLLLLLIPAFAMTLVLYFLINKKFRRTRNRIISIVLHSIVMVLCIFALSGISFSYELANLENEVLLLVDVSDTQSMSAGRRDEFVRTVIDECGYDGYKVGVVTFGFDQRYAVPLTYDTGRVYNSYKNAEEPDTSATNIAAALRYVLEENLFDNPETAKIVLITDGKETDEQAVSVIGSIAKQGIIVDTVYIASQLEDDRIQVTGVDFPDYHLNMDETFQLSVRLQCMEASTAATVQVFDNGVSAEGMTQTVDLTVGAHAITFPMVFDKMGLHEITVKITSEADKFSSNNEFSSYYFLEAFGRVLIIEHTGGESEALKSLLNENEIYRDNVEVLNLSGYVTLPESVTDLLQYDQIILNNIANSDFKNLPAPASVEDPRDWFVRMLNSYVSDYGGGLLTVGGKDINGAKITAHAYNRDDMYNTMYQEMLPVEIIDYTPPVAVMLIIDISGSMGSVQEEGSALYYAKEGAINCLSALTDRDYVGVMTLDTNYSIVLPLTRRTEETRIREAINGIKDGETTVYSDAIKTAGELLRRQEGVDKRHIVMVSDGKPGEPEEDYLSAAADQYKNGITISFVGVNLTADEYDAMEELSDVAGGKVYTASGRDLIDLIRTDLNAPAIKEIEQKDFAPIVANERSPLFNGVEYGTNGEFGVKLSGFFGVKKRESADVLLVGDYDVPLYAQWKYGKGMIGSFMCDLEGSSFSWSSAFRTDPSGQRFLYNVVSNLMPTENIHPGDIRLELKEENYINQLSIYTTLENGQKIVGKIIETTAGGEVEHAMNIADRSDKGIYVTMPLSEQNRYSRCNFVLKRSGVYRIVIEKQNADGTVVSSMEIYKAFAYSEEYNSLIEETEGENLSAKLEMLAESGNGTLIGEDDPWSVFTDFVTSLTRTYDPRLIFLIVAMVLFLSDIAIRKFKFKWIHELVRERKAKKAGTK